MNRNIVLVPEEVAGPVVRAGPVDHCHSAAVSCCEGSYEARKNWGSPMVDQKSWGTKSRGNYPWMSEITRCHSSLIQNCSCDSDALEDEHSQEFEHSQELERSLGSGLSCCVEWKLYGSVRKWWMVQH